MITKYYGKVICSEDTPMVLLSDVLEIIDEELAFTRSHFEWDLLQKIRSKLEEQESDEE